MLDMIDPALVLIAICAAISLWILVDCVNTPADRIRFLPKLVWLLILFHGSVFAALVWVYFGKRPMADSA
ncbi:hypothetical protein [Streptomyces sp. NPDC002580]|uniref:hypothetical protein n=1 Tax=Streptomyces sp. NPDC002580 TaxID=3364653 RepID=UPI0036B3C503